MTLDDFEECFNNTILQRAQNYYKAGNVLSLEEEKTGEWVAEVEGSERYTVTVRLRGREIESAECNCPYDSVSHCKHQGAVLFALRERFQREKSQPKNSNKSKKAQLQTILSAQSKEELVALILELANKDRHLKNDLLLQYSDKSDIMKYAKALIQNSIRAAKRGGFVEYGDTRKAVQGANAVLDIISEKIEAKDMLSAVKLCVIVLEEMNDLSPICDESNYECSAVIASAIEKIQEAINKRAGTDESTLFEIIFTHALSPVYIDWSSNRIELLSALVPLCTDKNLREKLKTYLMSSDGMRADAWGGSYDRKRRQQLTLEIIKKFDGTAAGEKFIESHFENDEFRKQAIYTALRRKQYEKALCLCTDGARNSKDKQGLVRDYEKLRFVVYEQSGDTDGQKTLATKFLLEGSFEYYKKLKALIHPDEWTSVRDELLEKLKNKKEPDKNPSRFYYWDEMPVYLSILVEENLTAKLMEYCEKSISAIAKYSSILLAEYPDKVKELFKRYILNSAEVASNRTAYKDVCAILRQYKKLFGTSMDEIRDNLSAQYKSRPAFLDELRRIK